MTDTQLEIPGELVSKLKAARRVLVLTGAGGLFERSFEPNVPRRPGRASIRRKVAEVFFDPALAIKITIKRPIDSGGIGDTDVYGAQQHAPLFDVSIPAR